MKPINYEGFKLFMETYLEVDMPEDLCRHLFLSFVKKTPGARALTMKGNKDVTEAVVATTATACAPITGSHGNLLESGQSEGLWKIKYLSLGKARKGYINQRM